MTREIQTVEEKIRARTARIAIIGIGYVGLPLAVAFAEVGFPTVGLDLDADKVAAIHRGESYIPDVESAVVRELVQRGLLRASTDYQVLRDADVIFICVPTPFDRMKAPDLSAIRRASEGIARHLRREQLVILQSTTYPGTTEEFVLPILETSGLKAGVDFYLAFSPERIDPGNKEWSARNTPKVLGGLTPRSTELARELLATLTPQVHLVSSPRAAEMTKLLENIFRSVNIALVNELALLCERMGIDIWEVIEAAKTKPFGFMPFYPGAGVGGHCLAPEEFVVVRGKNGCETLPLRSLFEQATERYEVNGVTLARPVCLEILSFDPQTYRTEFRPIRYLSARPYSGPMVEIVTMDGRRLKVTDGHPILVWDGAGISIRHANALKTGDQILIAKGLPVEEKPLQIDLLEALPLQEYSGVRVRPKRGHFGEYRTVLLPHLRRLLKYPNDVFRSNSMPLETYLAIEQIGDMPFQHHEVILCTGRGAALQQRMPVTQSKDHGSFATVKIKEIRSSSPVGWVYSVEVDDVHTFVTSYGIVVHNCIPVDPYYLSWKAREYDFYTKFIELAAEVNQGMPFHVVQLVNEAVNRLGKALDGAAVLVLGVAFKRDIDDARNSPAARVIELLLTRNARVQYHDPYVPRFRVGGTPFYHTTLELESVPLTAEGVRAADAVVIVTGHRRVDYGLVLEHARCVVDTTNVTNDLPANGHVVRLGAPAARQDALGDSTSNMRLGPP